MSQLHLNIASFSDAGIKPVNEDAISCSQPADGYTLTNKGVTLALADGVSTAEAGKEASHTAVNRFIEDYYKTPSAWSVAHSGACTISTINFNLFRKSHEFLFDTKGYLCTFSAVVIKGRKAHFFHVGDSRIYLTSKDDRQVLKQLSTDHVDTTSGSNSCLARALGIDSQLNLDYGCVDVNEGDRFLITSDGVHDFVNHDKLTQLMASDYCDADVVNDIKAAANANNTNDNLSAIVATIEGLEATHQADENYHLPIAGELKHGMVLDDFLVIKVIQKSNRSNLYLVRDESTGEKYVMKTPATSHTISKHDIELFVQEEWLGSRIDNEHVAKVIPQHRQRTALYYLMEYIDGEVLTHWLENHPLASPKQRITLVKQIAKGLQAFHDNEAVHQGINPENIMITKAGKALLVDFSSVQVAGLKQSTRTNNEQDAVAYSDPYYLMGKSSGVSGDIFSLAATAYKIFTGDVPYGKEVVNCKSSFEFDRLRYIPANSHNEVIPVWFDAALEKALLIDLDERYLSVENFMHDLTQPNPKFLKADPVIEKNTNKLILWQLLSGFWLLSFVLIIYLFNQFS